MSTTARSIGRMATLAAAALLLAACETAPKVSTDYNPAYDFSGRTRFAVLRPDVAQGQGNANAVAVPNDLVAQRIVMAIENALAARGYQLVPAAQADMIVTFFVTTQNQVDVRTYNAGFGYGACWTPYRCAMYANPQVDVRNYKEGTLYIDFIDPKERKLEWRGVTSDRLPSTPSREKRDQIVNEAVGAILAQYPPGAAAP